MATTVRISNLPADTDPANSNSIPVDDGSTVRRVSLPDLMESEASKAALTTNLTVVEPKWSGFPDAPALSLPNLMQRRYIDVGSIARINDALDAHAAIQAAFDAGEGREIVFSNPVGGKRYYRSLTRPAGAGATTSALIMPKRARIIMEPGAVLDFSSWANSGNVKYYLYANGGSVFGSPPASVLLGANAAAGASSLTLSVGGGASVPLGWHILVSDALYTTEEGALGTKSEWVYVAKKAADTLTLLGLLRDTYLTADNARLYPMTDLCQLSLEGVNLIGCGQFSTDTFGDRGIGIENGINCRVIGGSVVRSDFLSVTMTNVLNGLIDGVRVEIDPKGTNTVNQYGPHLVNVCENVTVRNCDVVGGKEALGLTSSGGIQGLARDCSFVGNRARGAWRSGICTHDNQAGIKITGNVIEDCEQGIDIRILGAEIRGNTIRRTGTGLGTLNCGVQLGSGAGKTIIDDNLFENVGWCVIRPSGIVDETATGPVGDIFIRNNIGRGITQFGVQLRRNAADDEFALGTVEVSGNDFTFVATGGFAPRGVEIEGNWNTPNVSRNTIRGAGGGAANRAVYLHNTSAGGTFGPINPIVVGNRWDADEFTEPLIQHSTGLWTVKDNAPFDMTALPTVASASGPTLPINGDVFSVTGTTTINTIANAARLLGQRITLVFEGTLTVTHNSGGAAAADTLQLSGAVNFSATAGKTLTLAAVYNSASSAALWREVSRSS
jgi:hypothetical protein